MFFVRKVYFANNSLKKIASLLSHRCLFLVMTYLEKF